MNRTLSQATRAACLAAVVAVCLGGASARAQSTNAPAASLDFSAFKLVTERNIFDPTRRGATSTYRQRDTSRPRRTEYVTLVGTMNYEEKGPLAFFDGSASAYRKVLKPSETIAGYTVAEVGTASVKLSAGTNELSLPVGMQLRKDEDGAWHISEPAYSSSESSDRGYSSSSRSARPPTFTATAAPAPTTTVFSNGDPNVPQFDPNAPPMIMNGEPPPEFAETNAPPEAAPSSGGDADSVLQKLMQRRAQELNR